MTSSVQNGSPKKFKRLDKVERFLGKWYTNAFVVDIVKTPDGAWEYHMRLPRGGLIKTDGNGWRLRR